MAACVTACVIACVIGCVRAWPSAFSAHRICMACAGDEVHLVHVIPFQRPSEIFTEVSPLEDMGDAAIRAAHMEVPANA